MGFVAGPARHRSRKKGKKTKEKKKKRKKRDLYKAGDGSISFLNDGPESFCQAFFCPAFLPRPSSVLRDRLSFGLADAAKAYQGERGSARRPSRRCERQGFGPMERKPIPALIGGDRRRGPDLSRRTAPPLTASGPI